MYRRNRCLNSIHDSWHQRNTIRCLLHITTYIKKGLCCEMVLFYTERVVLTFRHNETLLCFDQRQIYVQRSAIMFFIVIDTFMRVLRKCVIFGKNLFQNVCIFLPLRIIICIAQNVFVLFDMSYENRKLSNVIDS